MCIRDSNRNSGNVTVNEKSYAPNTVVYTMKTDATGSATTPDNLLPYGRWEIVEQTPPTGYLNAGTIRREFNITDNGVIVKLKTSDTTIKNKMCIRDRSAVLHQQQQPSFPVKGWNRKGVENLCRYANPYRVS